MESAVAVQTKGRALAFHLAVYRSIRSTSSDTFRNDPRRIACRVMILNQISTWLSHEAYVGV